jgi:hypothetical protein
MDNCKLSKVVSGPPVGGPLSVWGLPSSDHPQNNSSKFFPSCKEENFIFTVDFQ